MSVNKAVILEKIIEVVRDQLDDYDLELTADTTNSEVPGWDSLAHVRIVIGVEHAFGVRFTAKQIAAISSVGQMVEMIAESTSK